MNYEQPSITEPKPATQGKIENELSKKPPLLEIPRVLIVLFSAIFFFVAALYYGVINP